MTHKYRTWLKSDDEKSCITVKPGSRGKGKSFEADYEAEGYDARMEGRTAFGMAGDEELAAQVSMLFKRFQT